MYNTITDPYTNKAHSIFSEQGKTILKQYINDYNKIVEKIGGGKDKRNESNIREIRKSTTPYNNRTSLQRKKTLRTININLKTECFKSLYYGSKIDHIPIFYDVNWENNKFTIMFWNIQGTSDTKTNWSKIKKECVTKIITENNPDLIFLSEVSNNLEKKIPNYKLLAESIELDRKGSKGTKDLRLYAKKDSILKGRINRSSDTRAWLSTNITLNHKQLKIIGLHAKSSVRGGKENIMHIMEKYFKSDKTSDNISYIIGGDFNLDPRLNRLWGIYKIKMNTYDYVDSFGAKVILPNTIEDVFKAGTQKSGNILDYVISSSEENLNIQAKDIKL